MALFRRKQQQSSILPDEVNQYYQSQRRERTGVVFMLGILALIATLLVGLSVFFGGRYIYNKVRGNDTQPNTTVQTDNNKINGTLEISEAEKNRSNNSGDQEVAPTENTESTTEAETNTAPDQTPNLGDEPEILPATGDEGH